MKRLLLPLLAALSLPTAVNAQVANYYLLVEWKKNNWTVPMQSKQLCEAAGQEVLDQKNNLELKVMGKMDSLTIFVSKLSDSYVWCSDYLWCC